MKTESPAKLHWGLLLAFLGVGVVIIIGLLIAFPNLTSNPRILALAIATPLLAVLGTALSRSGLKARLPRPTGGIVRGLLALVVMLDIIVLLLPVFIKGPTAHDTTPQFTTVQATMTTLPTNATTTIIATTPTAVAQSSRSGTFDHRSGVDTVAGKAIIGTTTDGSVVLHLQDFVAANGPDVFIYLTPGNSPTTTDGAFEIGKLRAPNGDQNYTLSPTLDLSKYHAVLIYCKSFSAVFGYANLS